MHDSGAFIECRGSPVYCTRSIVLIIYAIVMSGTYKGAGNKELTFRGMPKTVVSMAGAFATIIDCEQYGRGFTFNSGEGPASILSGTK